MPQTEQMPALPMICEPEFCQSSAPLQPLSQLIGSPDNLEIETQYDLASPDVAAALRKLCRRMDAGIDGIRRLPGVSASRPISVYYDTKNLPLVASGITLRLRYGGGDYQLVRREMKRIAQVKGAYPHQAGFKVDVTRLGVPELVGQFAMCERQVARRIEIERPIDPASFVPKIQNFLPATDLPRDAVTFLWGMMEGLVRRDALRPIFVTDCPRERYDVFVPLGKGRRVGFEITVDDCWYYAVDPNARAWVRETEPPAEHGRAILLDSTWEHLTRAVAGNDLRHAKVNGSFLAHKPQFEIEYNSKNSTQGLSDAAIVEAEGRISDLFRKNLGEGKFAPKEPKGRVGYQLYSAAFLQNSVPC